MSTSTATAEKLSIYRLMDDASLAAAITSLEETTRALRAAQGEIGHLVRAGYEQALDQARLEVQRRRI